MWNFVDHRIHREERMEEKEQQENNDDDDDDSNENDDNDDKEYLKKKKKDNWLLKEHLTNNYGIIDMKINKDKFYQLVLNW